MANCAKCGRKLPPFSFKKICEWCVQHEQAKRGELDDDAPQPVMAVPWARRGASSISLTKLLFGANVAVFIAMAYASGSIENFPGEILGHFGANFGPYTLAGDWWRLVTYMFLHLDLWHIAFNMWCLWDLGALCESLYGTWTFGAVYLIAGVAGGLARLAWDPMVPSVGASGAIFGLAGALIASLYLGEFSIPRYAIQANLRSLLFFVGFNVLFGISPIGDLIGVHVDNACHIGGLVSGLILGALIARLAPQENEPARRVTVIAVVAIALLGAGFGVRQWRGAEMHFARSGVFSVQNIDHTISDLQNKIKQNPQDASAHYALAHAFFTKGNFPEGTAELKRVLELQPQNASARLDLGAAYLELEQPKQAQEAFATLVAQDPENVRGHVGLGIALADQQNYAGAISEYKAALQIDSKADGVYYRLGISQAQLKKYDDAIASYLKERENNGDDATLESALADAYQAKGLLQEAEEARTKAAQLKNSQQQ
jgi:membrane associated rhomboid family serine protease/Flp pilus assembly protein TadD